MRSVPNERRWTSEQTIEWNERVVNVFVCVFFRLINFLSTRFITDVLIISIIGTWLCRNGLARLSNISIPYFECQSSLMFCWVKSYLFRLCQLFIYLCVGSNLLFFPSHTFYLYYSFTFNWNSLPPFRWFVEWVLCSMYNSVDYLLGFIEYLSSFFFFQLYSSSISIASVLFGCWNLENAFSCLQEKSSPQPFHFLLSYSSGKKGK